MSLAGCGIGTPPPPDLVAQGVYRLQADTADGCRIEAEVTGRDGQLWVTGRMTARHHPDGPVTATGEAQVVAPDGRLLSRQPLEFEPLRHGRHGSHPAARFSVTFPELPPVGSTVRIRHRLAPYDPAAGLPRIR
ncbi:hypothetical protein J0H58_33725 [bacterium]|nr:hypothetical protein [bacterium]